MKKRSAPFLIPVAWALLLLAAPLFAGAGVWTTGGPMSLPNASLSMAPSDPAVLYLAAGESGLYRTTDGGATWARLPDPVPGQGAWSIVVHPASPDTVYAPAGGRLFRSTDGGATWMAVQSDVVNVAAVAFDPDRPSTVYASSGRAVYRSTDDGLSWIETATFSFPYSRPTVIHIGFQPAHPSTLFAIVNPDPRDERGNYLLRSRDGGATWTAVGRFGGYDSSVHSILVGPGSPETVLLTTSDGMFRSSDGGNTWTFLSAAPAGSSPLAIDPADPSRLYVGQNGSGIGKSTDGGATWTPIQAGLPPSRVSSLVIDARYPSTLYAGTADGVFRSEDSGATWTSSSVGLTGSNVLSVAVGQTNPNHVYAGTSQGLHATADGGRTWEPAGLGDMSVRTMTVAPGPAAPVFAAVDGPGIFRSSDGGQTWSPASTGIAGIGGFMEVSAIAIDPVVPTTLYAFESMEGAVYKSTDGGLGWTGTRVPAVITSFAIDATTPSVVYAGAYYYDAASPGAFFKSLDGGATWTESREGLRNSVSAIALDPVDHSVLYVGTDNGVFKSSDGGTTWTAAGAELAGRQVSALAIDPGNREVLYAATSQDGVYRTADGGRTWLPFNDGLASLAVTSLALDAEGRTLHAGTLGRGVFDLDLSDASPGPCVADPSTLCLLGNRFRVTIAASDPARGRATSGHAVAQGDRFGYFSFPDFTRDAELPEVVVKMVDASAAPGHSFWFFHSGMTSKPYVLTVTDTATGSLRTYSSQGYCGVADTDAFRATGAGPAAGAGSERATTLTASGNSLSLLSGRFQVTLVAHDPHTNRDVAGTAIPQGDRFGYFSLPEIMHDPAFPEVFVKMLDGSSFNSSIWVFHTSLTGLPYTLTVTDTVTGAVQTYRNDHAGTTELCGAADTSAFRLSALPPTGSGLTGIWSGFFDEAPRGSALPPLPLAGSRPLPLKPLRTD